MSSIVWTRESAGGMPALVGRDERRDYCAYAAPDVDDPLWTFLAHVRFDLALGAMPVRGSATRTLTLADLLAEAPLDHHAWIRDVTEHVLERALRDLRERVDELDDDDDGAASNLRQVAAVAAAAASLRDQLAAVG